MKKTKCMECGQRVDNLQHDPRETPIIIDPCLCADCFEAATIERIEELETEIERLRESLTATCTATR